MHARPAGLGGDPARIACTGGHLTVERHRRLEHHERASGAGVLSERLVEQARLMRQIAVEHVHTYALVAQDAEAAAGCLIGGIVRSHHHARDASSDDRLRARRRAAVVAARLERHVHRGARGVLRARGERLALGVRLAGGRVEALADRAIALDHHGAHEWIGARVPARSGGELDGPVEVALVALSGRGFSHESPSGSRIDSRVKCTSGVTTLPQMRRLFAPAPLLLALILVIGLLLRLWHNDYGLPYIWGIDEGSHFANRAVDMFREGFDPGYYQNPAGYTYLVYGLLRLMYGPFGAHLAFHNVPDQFNQDPTAIWTAARSLAAVLCMLGVAATYFAAGRLWGARHGLVAAGLV